MTGAKYNYMLDEQRKADKRELLPLLPGVKAPQLPPLPAEPDAAAKSATPDVTVEKPRSEGTTPPPDAAQPPR
jgi:hypothetical protein